MDRNHRVFMLLEGGNLQGYSRFRLPDIRNIFWSTWVLFTCTSLLVRYVEDHYILFCVAVKRYTSEDAQAKTFQGGRIKASSPPICLANKVLLYAASPCKAHALELSLVSGLVPRCKCWRLSQGRVQWQHWYLHRFWTFMWWYGLVGIRTLRESFYKEHNAADRWAVPPLFFIHMLYFPKYFIVSQERSIYGIGSIRCHCSFAVGYPDLKHSDCRRVARWKGRARAIRLWKWSWSASLFPS